MGGLSMTRRGLSRGDRNAAWVDEFCLMPTGPHRGERARLTVAQREMIRRMYDAPDGPLDLSVTDKELAAWLALLYLCGPEAVGTTDFRPGVDTDIFTLWAAAGPELRAVLKREGERIVCPELGTRYPAWAA
jgi:hypothetical protein